jgi:hypothetical protein
VEWQDDKCILNWKGCVGSGRAQLLGTIPSLPGQPVGKLCKRVCITDLRAKNADHLTKTFCEDLTLNIRNEMYFSQTIPSSIVYGAFIPHARVLGELKSIHMSEGSAGSDPIREGSPGQTLEATVPFPEPAAFSGSRRQTMLFVRIRDKFCRLSTLLSGLF